MGIDVQYTTGEDLDRWNGLVERSPHGTPFHLREVCEVVADAAGAAFRPIIGYKGQEPVGVFPTYEVSYGPLTAVFSPPPDLKVTYHGPAMVNVAKLKTRKADRRNRRFVEGALELLEEEVDPSYMHVRTGSQYVDTRPFLGRGFDGSPGHTYVVDLDTDEETLLGRFSSDARQNVTREFDGVDVELGDARSVRAIVEQVERRHDEQDERFPVSPSFVTGLYRAAPEGIVRPYVCHVDGEYAGGMVALALDDTMYRWMGGAKHDEDVPVNDLIDWHIIRDAMDRGCTRYDLVGASEPSIARYKAKFAPEVELYQQLEWGTLLMRVVSTAYKRVQK